MQITKEAILTRLAAIEKDKIQTLANLNALEGSIMDCKYWLSIIEKEDSTPQEA